MLIVPDASNRHPGYLAPHPEASDPLPYALVSPEPIQTPPWPGSPLRAERRFALGTPPEASSIRDRAHPTTQSPTGPDSPRVTVISPLMSSPHLVNVYSPRVTVISPRAGMSAPHLVDVYSPRVTLVSRFPGMLVSHLVNVDCSLYYLKTIA
jgi:hypothetical protein